MRVLIFGGTGMFGHKLWQVCRDRFDTHITVRDRLDHYAAYELFEPERTVEGVTVENFDSVVRTIATVRPDVVLNCIGIVRQVAAASDTLANHLTVNALFPHRVAQVCRAGGIRFIHISSDSVFSGGRGGYVEEDPTDPRDLYGRTKLLGEVTYDNCLTLRTVMVGRELATSHGLLEWFLAQDGRTISGYHRALFTGFTSIRLAQIVADVIAEHPMLQGIRHVGSEPISKLDVLTLVRDVLQLDITIEADCTVSIDRSLDSSRFCRETGYTAPSWPAMVEELARDPTPYLRIRRRLPAR